MSLVLTTGTFNIIHAGHIELLDYCCNFGKVHVGINADNYVLKKYGKKAIPLEYRLMVLKSLKQVSCIHVFEEDTPVKLINQIKPSIYVKGPDYRQIKIPEADILKKLGIMFLIPDSKKILSTSNII